MAMKNAEGEPNNRNVVTYVANERKTVNIPDVYLSEDFDFSGTKSLMRLSALKAFVQRRF